MEDKIELELQRLLNLWQYYQVGGDIEKLVTLVRAYREANQVIAKEPSDPSMWSSRPQAFFVLTARIAEKKAEEIIK